MTPEVLAWNWCGQPCASVNSTTAVKVTPSPPRAGAPVVADHQAVGARPRAAEAALEHGLVDSGTDDGETGEKQERRPHVRLLSRPDHFSGHVPVMSGHTEGATPDNLHRIEADETEDATDLPSGGPGASWRLDRSDSQ